jgi:hypothetical protein
MLAAMKVSRNIAERLEVALLMLFLLFVVTMFLSIWIGTSRKMKQADLFLRGHHNESELRATYRKPTAVYQHYGDVPEYYRNGMDDYTNCDFYIYQREGMPYWFFVAAVNPESRMIEHGVVRELGK